MMRRMLLVLFGLVSAGLLSAQGVFNPVIDWDAGNNPSANGPWSLGYKTTVAGSLTLFTQTGTYPNGGATLEFWHDPSGVELGIGLNTSASLDWSDGPTIVNPQEINLHPGPTGQMAAIRFTAPATSDYDFSGVFSGNSGAGTSTTAYLVHNTTTFHTQAVTGYNSVYGLTVSRSLTAGDTVDLVVDWGANANYFNDSTGIYLTVIAVPEPAACALVGGLLALAGVVRFRWRRTTPRPVA